MNSRILSIILSGIQKFLNFKNLEEIPRNTSFSELGMGSQTQLEFTQFLSNSLSYELSPSVPYNYSTPEVV